LSNRPEVLDRELPLQEAQLQQHSKPWQNWNSRKLIEWQQIQAIIKSHEQQMQERVGALRTAEQRLKRK